MRKLTRRFPAALFAICRPTRRQLIKFFLVFGYIACLALASVPVGLWLGNQVGPSLRLGPDTSANIDASIGSGKLSGQLPYGSYSTSVGQGLNLNASVKSRSVADLTRYVLENPNGLNHALKSWVAGWLIWHGVVIALTAVVFVWAGLFALRHLQRHRRVLRSKWLWLLIAPFVALAPVASVAVNGYLSVSRTTLANGSLETPYAHVGGDFLALSGNKQLDELRSVCREPADGTRVVHISDVHDNVNGLALARYVADTCGVAVVFDSGDTTSFCLPRQEDSWLLSAISGFRQPYVWVAGNHDSPDFRLAMSHMRNVVSLNGTAKVKGLSVYGRPDPLFTACSKNRDHLERILQRTDDQIGLDLVNLPKQDVVMTHDPAMVKDLDELDPLFLSGHLHRFKLTAALNSLTVNGGTTGAGGIESRLVPVAEADMSLEVLTFKDKKVSEVLQIAVKTRLDKIQKVTLRHFDITWTDPGPRITETGVTPSVEAQTQPRVIH